MLPGCDVRFLQSVCRHLREQRLHVYTPGARRSAAALILRFAGEDQRRLERLFGGLREASLTGEDMVRHMAQHVAADAPSSLRLLFMKRADVAADRWSGQVAFPGGRRDPEDADDLHTAYREVYESIGIPLGTSREFLLLGQMRDFMVRSRQVDGRGLVQSRFVFLHVGALTPSVQLARHEIAGVAWMPLDRLRPEAVQRDAVTHPIAAFVQPADADAQLLLKEFFPSTFLSFPSARLAPAEGEAPGVPAVTWAVWGLTLRSAGELLVLGDREPADWPLCSTNSALLRLLVVHPYHGYYELCYQLYKLRYWASRGRVGGHGGGTPAQRWHRFQHGTRVERRQVVLPAHADPLLYAVPEQPTEAHLAALGFVTAAALLLLYTVAAIIYTLGLAVRVALGFTEINHATERRIAYHVEKGPYSVERERRRYAEETEHAAASDGEGEAPLPVAPADAAMHTPERDTKAQEERPTVKMIPPPPPPRPPVNEAELGVQQVETIDDVLKRYR